MKKDTNIDKLPESARDDTALLHRVRKGDISAFEQIYYRWNRQVYGFMLKTTRSEADSEDITQEVFIRLWNMRENIDPQKNIQSLIFTIARRIAVDMYRHSGKSSGTMVDGAEENVSHDGDRSPQEILEEQETNLLLDIAIENMPEKQRLVFSMFYYQNLSPKDIAAQLGLSYDNVRKHIYNGKQHLRKIVSMIAIFLLGQI